jgi:O-methyltransferase
MPDIEDEDIRIISEVRGYTMTSSERVYSLVNAVRYVIRNNIAGAVVECGVWKGGSMMAVAKTLLQLGVTDRDLYLFDTFAGMTAPTEKDRTYMEPKTAQESYRNHKDADGTCRWAYAPYEEARRNVLGTGYPESKIHFIVGPVEKTLPDQAPEKIALLRLDTDFYESTKHELVHLYPRLSAGGPIVIDDYGHWQGARLAVDEFLKETNTGLLLNRIDYTGRIGVKL